MVRTPRHLPAPRELVQSKAQWTHRWGEICVGRKKGDWATKGAKSVLKRALLRLAHGKCAFCEGTLGSQGYLQIEHYVAKTVDPSLTFEWTNLLPACAPCNGAKGHQDHRNLLLKSDDEDPEPYFWINPDNGELEPHPSLDDDGKARALTTIQLCKLQRGQLCEKRHRMAMHVGHWLNRASVCGENLTGDLAKELDWLLRPATEYKLAIRHVLELRGAGKLAQEDRQRFEAPTAV
jgi:uncharacterized protein (TIGR02646 family)